MIHDAKVEVTCDGNWCRDSIFVDLVAGSGQTYLAHDSAIEREVKAEGWKVVSGKHYCEGCAEDAGADDRG